MDILTRVCAVLVKWYTAGPGKNIEIRYDVFDVRQKNEMPDMSYDVYISSGGPGDPLSTRFEDWDIKWNKWFDEINRWNNNPATVQKNIFSSSVILFNWRAGISMPAFYANADLLHSAPSLFMYCPRQGLIPFLKI